jgi:hypothetical protein
LSRNPKPIRHRHSANFNAVHSSDVQKHAQMRPSVDSLS